VLSIDRHIVSRSPNTICVPDAVTVLQTHPIFVQSPRLFAGSQLVEESSSPRDLPSSESIQARIIAVVHPVVNRVNAATCARVLANGATRRGSLLGWRVGDLVASTGATTLEDVEEAKPMANFVGGRSTFVETSSRTARQGICQVDAAVQCQIGRGRARLGEVAPV
jgi:hypothetical protein